MGTTEREAQRDDLRERIIEAARDIVSEHGLDGLSMRALAQRIGHSPGTIYHHFQDKDELLRSVITEGFRRMGRAMERQVEELGAGAPALEIFAAQGRAYARFALENTGYFRVMFEVPGVAQVEKCPSATTDLQEAMPELPAAASREYAVELLRQASEAGDLSLHGGPSRAAVVGWGLIHGLTSLYVSGHLGDEVRTHEEFMDLVENAIQALGVGWIAR